MTIVVWPGAGCCALGAVPTSLSSDHCYLLCPGRCPPHPPRPPTTVLSAARPRNRASHQAPRSWAQGPGALMTVPEKGQQGGLASLSGHQLPTHPPALVVPHPSHFLDPSSRKPPQPLRLSWMPWGPNSPLPASRSPQGGQEREALRSLTLSAHLRPRIYKHVSCVDREPGALQGLYGLAPTKRSHCDLHHVLGHGPLSGSVVAHRCPLHGSGPESVASKAGATYPSRPAQSTRSLHIAWPRTQEKTGRVEGREGEREGRAKSPVTPGVPCLRRLGTLICGISPKSLCGI